MIFKLWIVSMLLLTACSSSYAPHTSRTAVITCTVAYRASVEMPIEREETVTFEASNAEQAISFTDLVFHAAYNAGIEDNERSLRLWVTDVENGHVHHTQLYQLAINNNPQNQFRGGHGFTGLGYIYHPDSQAEMHYWCATGEQ